MSVSILIVDDEPDVAELFRQRFRREVREGRYVMHFAASAEEALGKLDTITPAIFRAIHVDGQPLTDEKEIQKLTDQYTAEVDRSLAAKEKEILTV